MTDYPTRAEIDAAANTIEALQNCVDRGVPAWGVTWSGLETAREILTQLDAVPGVLHYPDPEPEPEPKPKPTAAEPQPTAAEVLYAAWDATGYGTPERGITLAAARYAEAHPEWFAAWHDYEDANASLTAAAAQVAVMAADDVALDLLTAAAGVAKAHPELFGGAA